MEVQKKQITYINILKGIAIIAVVLGHAESPFKKFIYLFQIALFFFVSGYLYKDIYTDKPWMLIKKRFKSLYIPFLKWTLFFIVIHNLLYCLNIYKDKIIYDKNYVINTIKWLVKFNSTELMLAGFWFLKTLFLVSVIFAILNYTLSKLFENNYKKVQMMVIILIFVIGSIFLYSESSFNSKNIIRVSYALPIFYFGYLFKQYENKINMKLVYAFISAVVLYFLSRKGSIDMANEIFVNPIFYILSSILGIYLSVYVSKLINKNKVLEYIGKNTTIILALHFICFKIVDYLYIKYAGISMKNLSAFPVLKRELWLFYSIAGIFIPIILKLIYDKYAIKNMKSIFLGKIRNIR